MNTNSRRALVRVVAAVVGAAILLQLVRSVPRGVSNIFLPFWHITYAHGYVRRGLLGTVFQFFASGFTPGEQEMQVLCVHVLALAALFAGVLLETARLARHAEPRTRLLLATGTATFFLSRFVLTVAHCAGYQDAILLLLAFVAFALLTRDHLVPALVIAMVAVFIHEGFLFLWAPIALLALVRKQGSLAERARYAATLALPGIAAVIAVKLHSDSALQATLSTIPISPEVRDGIVRYSYGLSLGDAFDAATRGYREHPLNVVLGGVWVLPYSIVIAACAVALDRARARRSAISVAALATLAPCAVLLIAWDFSRFLVWSTFGAELALLAATRVAVEDGTRSGSTRTTPPLTTRELALPSAWLVLAALLSTGPHLFLYANEAFAEWPFGPAVLRDSPGAAIGLAFAGVYNRHRAAAYNLRDDTCKPEIDLAHGTRAGDACAFDIAAPGWLQTPPLHLPSGHLVAKVATSADPRCSAARARVQVVAYSRTGGERAAATLSAPGELALPFDVSPDDAATAFIRVVVKEEEGCLRIEGLELSR